MSKKKSYMDRKNILSENFLTKMFNLFKRAAGDKKAILSKTEKELMKDKSFVKALKDFNKHYDDVLKRREKVKKMLGKK